MATHPLVIHFREEHNGQEQEVLMRILSSQMTPLDRQVKESLNILRASRVPEECLNLKSEWGGSKLPGLQVSSPKGTGKKMEGREDKTEGNQGDKRIIPEPGVREGAERGSPKKRRRDSPDRRQPDLGWRKKPSFLTGQEEARTSTDSEPEPH